MKKIIFLFCILMLTKTAYAADISKLNGEWYSYKWKYGYTLKDGKGYATIVNSPNFKEGQEIVRLAALSDTSFFGENVYKDGKFYKVKVTLKPDGRLLFEGEKNAKWEMEKITSQALIELRKIPKNEEKAYADRDIKNEKSFERSPEKQPQYIKLNGDNCSSLTYITVGYAEVIGRSFEVNPKDVSFLGWQSIRYGTEATGCRAKIGHSKGVASCPVFVGVLQKNGKTAASSCVDPDCQAPITSLRGLCG